MTFDGQFDVGLLRDELLAAGLPLLDVQGVHAGIGAPATRVVLLFDRELTAQEQADVTAIVAAHVAPTPDQSRKQRIKDALGGDKGRLAVLEATFDEFNRAREFDAGLKAAVNDASGGNAAAVWTDFKNRVNALGNRPQLTLDDVIAAVHAIIDAKG